MTSPRWIKCIVKLVHRPINVFMPKTYSFHSSHFHLFLTGSCTLIPVAFLLKLFFELVTSLGKIQFFLFRQNVNFNLHLNQEERDQVFN